MNEEYVPEHILTAVLSRQLEAPRLSFMAACVPERMTCVGDQSLPRAVGIRRWLSPAAIARSDVAPAA